MSEELVRKALKIIGLTDKESEVYKLLGGSGVLRGMDISKRLSMHKAQVYSILKSLQRKGVVEATLESPTRFSAVSLEDLLDSFIRARRDEANSVEKEKDVLLASWELTKSGDTLAAPEKFVAIQGPKKIEHQILEMVNEAKKEIRANTTSLDIIRADQTQLTKEIVNKPTRNRAIKIRILTSVSKENLNIIKNTIKVGSNRHLDIKWRHLDLKSGSTPRVIIKDGEETFILQSEDYLMQVQQGTGLWTNSALITDVNMRLFTELWNSGIDIGEKMREVGTRKPLGRTLTIGNWQRAYEEFGDRMEKAKNEIIQIGPSIDILRHQGKYTIPEVFKRRVKLRAMFPLDADTLRNAQALSKYCEIRDPNVGYLGMALIDSEHLFQFNVQARNPQVIKPSFYFRNTFYTNEPSHIRRASEMLEGLWRRSAKISDIEDSLREKKTTV